MNQNTNQASKQAAQRDQDRPAQASDKFAGQQANLDRDRDVPQAQASDKFATGARDIRDMQARDAQAGAKDIQGQQAGIGKSQAYQGAQAQAGVSGKTAAQDSALLGAQAQKDVLNKDAAQAQPKTSQKADASKRV